MREDRSEHVSKFIQSYIVPVCLYSVDGDKATIRELGGTAFFINSHGVFLTARHVLLDAVHTAKAKSLQIGVVVKADAGLAPASAVASLEGYEFAAEPFDVAIGQTDFKGETLLSLSDLEVAVWQDVATVGYPIHAVTGAPDAMQLNIRCHKGYVQRLLVPGDVPIGTNPPAFELSFLLSRGISGAPLFVHARPKDVVVGVCVGSIRSEQVEDEHLEIRDGHTTYREFKLRIEQYGVAHSLRPLLDWRPAMFGGLSLLEVSRM